MTKDEIAAKWGWNWFGFWGDPKKGIEHSLLNNFIDSSWNPPDRDRLIRYLREAPVVVAASAGFESCLLCKERVPKAAFHSDGTWLWPSDLIHYMESHAVRLPSRLEEFIRAQQYLAPEKVKVKLDQLPWPTED